MSSENNNNRVLEKLQVLNVLLVEDDDNIRQSFCSFFLGKCNNLYVATDGIEGLELLEKNPDINVIISDINMPRLNGLEMLKEIREKGDFDGDIIFLTAHSDSSFLLKAIDLNVTNYLVKPIDLRGLILQLDKIGQTIINKNILENKKNEIKEYVKMLDQVAIVSKTNLKGQITYANSIFREISGYTNDELIGKPHNIVRHPDVPKEIFKELWETIKNKKTWSGKVKNLAKNQEAYITHTTIYPLVDELTGNIKEFMSIRFLITEEENQKREFKKSVMNTITENRRNDFKTKQKINDLQKIIDDKDIEIMRYRQNYELERQRIEKLNHQISCYEDDIKEMNNDFDLFKINTKNKLQEQIQKTEKVKRQLEKQSVKFETMESVNKEAQEQLRAFDRREQENLKIIRDLRDIIKHS